MSATQQQIPSLMRGELIRIGEEEPARFIKWLKGGSITRKGVPSSTRRPVKALVAPAGGGRNREVSLSTILQHFGDEVNPVGGEG